MILEDFTCKHLSEAKLLALASYEEERRIVPWLPAADIDVFPDLTEFAENGMGAAALEGNKLVGFLCSYSPFAHAFGSTDATGVFSPMGANAVSHHISNRETVYEALYQHAASKWVRAGAVSHGICLYAHDEAAQRQFFQYGFGLRCIDAIRPTEQIDCCTCQEYEFIQLAPPEIPSAYPLKLKLYKHFRESPFFLNRKPETLEEFTETYRNGPGWYFAARYQGGLCAFLKISNTGETFLTERPDYCHIDCAYCLPEHRGKGVFQNLLNYAAGNQKKNGFPLLGVDFESMNPTAYHFWLKYFSAYTSGVVRRIDERILKQ